MEAGSTRPGGTPRVGRFGALVDDGGVMSVAKESGHWYGKDGTPVYEIEGANGKLRSTTLRDARKLDLVPSVTTVLREENQPGLNRWITNQALLAAITLPRVEGESDDAFLNRALADSREQASKAAERGTQIHGELEHHFTGKVVSELGKRVEGALFDTFGHQDWRAERSFAAAYKGLWYAGKVDLYSPGLVVDFKTKEFEGSKKLHWPGQAKQLAAYRYLIGGEKKMVNVFISTTTGEIRLHEWQPESWFDQFACLLQHWYLRTGL